MISKSHQSHWQYDKEQSFKRFDYIDTTSTTHAIGIRTVENIYDVDKAGLEKSKESEYNYKIKDISNDIYLVFAVAKYEENIPKELQRVHCILKFDKN